MIPNCVDEFTTSKSRIENLSRTLRWFRLPEVCFQVRLYVSDVPENYIVLELFRKVTALFHCDKTLIEASDDNCLTPPALHHDCLYEDGQPAISDCDRDSVRSVVGTSGPSPADEKAPSSTVEIAAILPLLESMSVLIQETALYMQNSVQRVSGDFSSIVETARGAVETSRKGLDCYGNHHEVLDHVNRSLQLMDDIADEARLVGINGRLEAARAGEFGAAFNVVAMETRRLSEQTSTASRRIHESLDRLNEMHSGLLQSMKDTEVLSVHLSGNISSSVIGLQFQDLAFQRMMAVSDTLNALQKDLRQFAKGTGSEVVTERSQHWLDWFFSRPGLPPRDAGNSEAAVGGEQAGGTVELF